MATSKGSKKNGGNSFSNGSKPPKPILKKGACVYEGKDYSDGSVKEMGGVNKTCRLDNQGEGYWVAERTQ